MNVFNSVTSFRVLSYRKSKFCKIRRINIWIYHSSYLQFRPSWVTLHARSGEEARRIFSDLAGSLFTGHNIASVSRTKIIQSHGPITLGMFSTVLHPLLYSLSGNRHFARKEELMYESITALTSNAGHLGWQHMRSFTKWHLWYQHTIPLMHRDHLVGNLYFVPFFVFYTESVTLGPRFIPESVFYTQSVMLSPHFIP